MLCRKQSVRENKMSCDTTIDDGLSPAQFQPVIFDAVMAIMCADHSLAGAHLKRQNMGADFIDTFSGQRTGGIGMAQAGQGVFVCGLFVSEAASFEQ